MKLIALAFTVALFTFEFALSAETCSVRLPSSSGQSPLTRAVLSNDLAKVDELIVQKVDPNIDDFGGYPGWSWTPFILAIKCGYLDIASKLLLYGRTDINDFESYGEIVIANATSAIDGSWNEFLSLLIIQTRFDQIDKAILVFLRSLQSIGPESDWLDYYKKTWVILSKDPRANFNFVDKNGDPLLFLLSNPTASFVLDEFIKNPSVNLNVRKQSGESFIEEVAYLACASSAQFYFRPVLRRLLSEPRVNFNVDDVKGRALLAMVDSLCSDDVDLRPLFARADVNVNYRGSNGDTVLLSLAKEGFVGPDDPLLSDPRLDVNSRDQFGRSAIFYLAAHDSIYLAGELVKRADLNPNLLDNDGQNFVEFIARSIEKTNAKEPKDDFLKVAKLETFNLDHRGADGRPSYFALVEAFSRRGFSKLALVIWLQDRIRDFDINYVSPQGKHLVYFFINKPDAYISAFIEKLLRLPELKPSIEVTDSVYGKQPLSHFVANECFLDSEFFVRSDVSLYGLGAYGYTAVESLVRCKYRDDRGLDKIVRFLSRNPSFDVNRKGPVTRLTLLMHAGEQCLPATVKTLLRVDGIEPEIVGGPVPVKTALQMAQKSYSEKQSLPCRETIEHLSIF